MLRMIVFKSPLLNHQVFRSWRKVNLICQIPVKWSLLVYSHHVSASGGPDCKEKYRSCFGGEFSMRRHRTLVRNPPRTWPDNSGLGVLISCPVGSMYGLLLTLGEKWPQSRGIVGKYSLHEASGILLTSIDCRWLERLSIGLCFKWVVEIIWIWPMTAQWQARNATWILKLLKNFWLCAYLFFMDGFSELSWNMLHDLTWWKLLNQVPNLGSTYHPEPASPSNCFSYDFYVVFGLSSHSDHLRIISCFVWWQLLTVGNRDIQM